MVDKETENWIQAGLAALIGGTLAGEVYDRQNQHMHLNPEERSRWILGGIGAGLTLEHTLAYGKIHDDKWPCHGLLGLGLIALSLTDNITQEERW